MHKKLLVLEWIGSEIWAIEFDQVWDGCARSQRTILFENVTLTNSGKPLDPPQILRFSNFRDNVNVMSLEILHYTKIWLFSLLMHLFHVFPCVPFCMTFFIVCTEWSEVAGWGLEMHVSLQSLLLCRCV